MRVILTRPQIFFRLTGLTQYRHRGEAARTQDLQPETIRSWRKTERKYGERPFAGNSRAFTDEVRIAQLERTLGQLTLENAQIKKSVKLAQGAGSKKRRPAMMTIAQEFEGTLPKTVLASVLELRVCHSIALKSTVTQTFVTRFTQLRWTGRVTDIEP